MNYFPRGVPAVQSHNRSPSVTDDIEICESYMTALSSRTSTYVLVHGILCSGYDSSMPAAYLGVQIRNLMPPRKKSQKKC